MRPGRAVSLISAFVRLSLLLATALTPVFGPAYAIDTTQFVTAVGVPAWIVEDHSVPLVVVRFAFEGGALQDPENKDGLSSMMADLLSEGAEGLPGELIRQRLSKIGALISVSAQRDALIGGLDATSATVAEAADVLRSILLAPSFTPDALERVRARRIADIKRNTANPTENAIEIWYREAFRGLRYARSPTGLEATIGAIQISDLKAQHRRLLARDILKVVVVGDITKTAASALLDRIFAELPAKAQLTAGETVTPRDGGQPFRLEQRQPISAAAFGFAGLSRRHPDFPALQVLNHIIGSGDFDSELMNELRVKRGLTYAIQTALLQDAQTAIVLGTFATKPDNMQQAQQLLRTVLARVGKEGPNKTQFENSRDYLVGSILLDYDTSGKMADSLLNIWRDGEGPEALVQRPEAIRRVTLSDVQRVARRILDSDKLIIVEIAGQK